MPPLLIALLSALAPGAVQLTRDTSCTMHRRAAPPLMVSRVVILSVGKTKEKWLNEACEEYVTRLRPHSIDLECVWVKDDAALSAEAAKSGVVLVLDERGAAVTSEDFSTLLYDQLEAGGSRVSFVIGGANGLPPDLRATPPSRLLSLSRMTLTHQMARLLLSEQIYRASEIRRGSKYHRA